MKRIISVALLSIVIMFSVIVSAYAEQATSSGTGFTNIPFSNGYYGFCIDRDLKGAYTGDSFTPASSTSVANNNIDNKDVSQKLKILFTQCFEDIFVSDNNGGYVIDSNKADSSLPYAIYNITDNQYAWGESASFVKVVNEYQGPEIPDDGYTLQLDNGDLVTFSFVVMEPQKEDQQSFFAYKLTVSQGELHECEFGEEWESDDENHWHECECGEKSDEGEHNGNTADCVNPSVCETCKKELAGVDEKNHTGETVVKNAKPATEFEDGYTGDIYCADCDKLISSGKIIPATHECEFGEEWESDDENHWHECECGEKSDEEEHVFANGLCSVCGMTVLVADEESETNFDVDYVFDFVSDIASSVAFDYILGFVSNMDSVADFDFIFGLIPDFGSDSKQENADDESISTEIPDTGSELNVAFVLAILLLSLLTLAVMVFSKKKHYTK